MLRARLPAILFASALLAILVHVAMVGFAARGLAGLFPAIVGTVGAVAALANLIQAVRGRDAGSGEAPPEGADGPWLAGLSYGVPAAYAVMLWLLGFWAASAVTLLALPWLLGYRRPVVVLLVCVGTLLAVQLVFVQVFDMVLPRGLLVERLFDDGED
jgi:putative tricarboxylic transport membrane protein